MARQSIYPWELLTEVGDYFVVPDTFKPFQYMMTLVSQMKYKGKFAEKKLAAIRIEGGTIVILVQVGDAMPPHEYVTPEGIMSVANRRHMIQAQDSGTSELGKRMKPQPRRISTIVAQMSPEQRLENLPWWYDPRTGQLTFNSKVAHPEDFERWFNKTFNPKPDDPYPSRYNLDENLMRREVPESDDTVSFTPADEDEDIWAGEPVEESGDDREGD